MEQNPNAERTLAPNTEENRQAYERYVANYTPQSYTITYGDTSYTYSADEINKLKTAYRYMNADEAYSKKAYESYTNSEFDQFCMQNGLPSWKLWGDVEKYASGGDFKDNYGGVSDEQWEKINELWAKDWKYGLTDADAYRKANGLAPVSYDSMYEDTMLDAELKAKGLPPSKLLNGKLGEQYNSWVKDSEMWTGFMDAVLRRYIEKSGKIDVENNLFDVVFGALNLMTRKTYTLDDALNEMLSDPQWAEYANAHYGVRVDIPDQFSDEYIMTERDEFGSKYEVRDANGNVVYDTAAWNKDREKAMKNNLAIDADEFSITNERTNDYFAENGQQMMALMAAEREFADKGVKLNASNAPEFTDRWNDFYAGYTLNEGKGYTIDLLFPDANLSEEDRAKLQPFINKANRIRIEQGYEASSEYLVGGEFARELKQMNDDEIVAYYRNLGNSEDGSKYSAYNENPMTDEEILHEYYTSVGEPLGMTPDQILALERGELSISDYMHEKCPDIESAEAFVNECLTKELTDPNIPLTVEELYKKHTEAYAVVDNYLKGVDNDLKQRDVGAYIRSMQEFKALGHTRSEVIERILGSEEECDKFYKEERELYNVLPFADPEEREKYLGYLQKEEDVVRVFREQIRAIQPDFYEKVDTYPPYNLAYAEGKINEIHDKRVSMLVDAFSYTPEFAEKTADMDYVNQRFDQIIAEDAKSSADLSDVDVYATDDEKRKLVFMSEQNLEDADTYLNKILLHKWDNMAREDKLNNTAVWGEGSGWLGEFLGGVAQTLVSIPVNIGESVYNLGADFVELVHGNEILSSQRATWSTDAQSRIAQNISEGWTGDVGAFLYQLIPSTIQSGASMWLAAHTGGASEAFTLALMSAESYSGAVDQAIQNGASSGEAVLMGLVSGANEIIFEKVSLDSFLEQGRIKDVIGEILQSTDDLTNASIRKTVASQIGKRLLTHGIVEGFEELNTSVANLFAESLILGVNSSYNKSVERYIEAGFSHEEAEDRAMREVVKGVAMDFVGGLVSGAFMTFGNDMIDSHGGRVFFDRTGMTNFVSQTRNLSRVSVEDAIDYAKNNISYSNGLVTAESAERVFDDLRKQGADSATLSRVRDSLSTAEQIEANQGAQTVMQTAIREQRVEDSKKLINAASQVVYEKTTHGKGTVSVTEQEIARTTNEYLDLLTGTVQAGDIRNIEFAAEAMRTGYIDDIKKMAGYDTIATGMTMIGNYYGALSTEAQSAIKDSAKQYIATMNKAGVSGEVAGRYANAAAIIEYSTRDDNALTGLNSAFGDSASVSSDAVRNACLNANPKASMRFIDGVCRALSVLQSQDGSHLFSAAQNGTDSVAYVASQMALAQSMPEGSAARQMYAYIEKYGATAETMDLLTAANICASIGTEQTDTRKANGRLYTTEQLAQIASEYNKALTNYNNKQAIAQAHEQADATERTEHEARIERYSAQISELYAMMENADAATLESLIGKLANATSEFQNAQGALEVLIANQNQRNTQTRADLASAESAYNDAKAKYQNALRDHAAQYAQRMGGVLEAIAGHQHVSAADMRYQNARVMYGTEQDINDIDKKIIAAEKAAAVALGKTLGVDVQCVEFTKEFLKEHKVSDSQIEEATKKRGFRDGGTVYLNTATMKPEVGSLTNEVLLHEIGHFLEESADDYSKYKDFALKYMRGQNSDAANAFIAEYGEDELVAEFTRLVALADPRAVAALCKSAPKMSMRVFQFLTGTSNRMSSVAVSQSKIVRDAQRAFASGVKSVRAQNAEQTETSEKDAPKSSEMRHAEKMLNAVAQFDTTYDITKPFEEQVEDFVTYKRPSYIQNNAFVMGEVTPQLRKIGASNTPMLYAPGHMAYKTAKSAYRNDPDQADDHVFVNKDDTPEVKAQKIKAIRDAIYDPVAIITSRTDPNESVVMILDVESTNGKRRTAAVKIDGYAHVNGKEIDGHVATSVVGRSNAVIPESRPGIGLLEKALFDEANGTPSVLYWNEKKVNDLAQNGLKLPRSMPTSPYPHTLHDPDVSVKPLFSDITETQQFKRWSHGNDVDYHVDERTGEFFYVNDDGQMKSADKNIGTFDEDIERTDWYTEYNPDTFDAKQHDAEYMKLAKKYRSGTATHEDVVKIRSLVNAQALHQGVMGGDFDEPLDLYHGTPDFGFTEFDPTRSKGNLYTSTDPAVSNGYAGVAEKESDAPLTREVSSALDPRLRDEYLDNLSANGLARRANAIIPGAKISVSFTRGNYTTEDEFTDDVTGKKYDRELLYHDMRYAALDAMSEDELLRYAAQVLPNKLIEKSNDPNFEYQDLNNSGEPMNREDIIEYMLDEMGKGIYHLYGFAGDNQYRTDADEANWEYIYDEMGVTTDDIGENARDSGFTSTRIDNVIDPSGDYPGSDNTADDVIFYEPWQMKSADLVTVDDDGDIIPLSQRFDKTNSDIRYYTEYDPDAYAAQSTIEKMTAEEKRTTGDPRLIQTDHGFVVARKVSYEGLVTGNPVFNKGVPNLAMIAPMSEFPNGDVGRIVPLNKCNTLVVPNTQAYASMRADARDMGVNVYPYSEDDPTAFDRAITRAANQKNMQFMGESYEDFLERYGAKRQGAQPRVENRPVPERTSDTNRVSDMARTAAEAPVTTDEGYTEITNWITNGTGTYEPISNARTLAKARGVIERAGSVNQAAADLHRDVANSNGKATDLLARAELLYTEAQNPASGLTAIEREQIFGDMCIIASDAGRALQAATMLKRMTADGHIAYIEQVGNRMAERFEKRTKKRVNLKLTEDEKERYRSAVTEEQRQEIDKEVSERFSEATSELTLYDRIRNWRYFSMLGNPRTHFRNIVGNTLMRPVARLKDTINAGLQAAFRVEQADRTTSAWTGRIDAATKAFVEDQLRLALPTMQGVSSKYADEMAKSVTTNTDGSLKATLTQEVPTARLTNGKTRFGRFLNTLSFINSNALELEDARALGHRFRSSMYQIIKARGLDVNNMTEEQRQSIVNYSMEESLRATFRDASALADAINQFARTNRGTQFLIEAIVPFKKTPLNIAKRSIGYSPIGLVNGIYKLFSNTRNYNADIKRIESDNNLSTAEKEAQKRDAENTAKMQKIAAIDRLSQGLTGSLLTAIGLFASKMGWISIGRKDDEEAAFEQGLGKNTYSLNIGDMSIDLSAFSPAAVPMLMGSALYEAIGAEHDGGALVSDLISVLCESVDPITEMSMVSGIADALQGISYSANEDGGTTRYIGTVIGNAASSYIGQFIPTFVGQVARVTDPYARSYSAGDEYWASAVFGSEVGSVVKSLQNKIPFVSWLSEPKVDVHGNPVKNYTNWGSYILHPLNNFILPATIKQDSKNEIDDELVRLYGVVDSADIFPTKPSRNLGAYTDKRTGQKYQFKITNDSEYTQYQMEVGQTTYDMLEDLMQSRAYARMTDEQKAEAIENVISQAQSAVKKRWKAQKVAAIGK